MYVKVHKENGRWFRCDNETIVGKDCFCNDFSLSTRIFAKQDDKVYPIYEGYFDRKGNFIHFCMAPSTQNCLFCSQAKRNMFCRRELNALKEKTAGYYIKSD